MAAPRPSLVGEVHSPPATARPVRFYGWYVVGAVVAIAFVAWGVNLYNLGVFLYALQVDRGWSRAALAGGAALFSLVSGLTGLAAGRFVDRHGPRAVLLVGGLTTGIAMLGLGQVQAVWQVYLCDALLAVGFGCTHIVVLSALIARWFVRRRALALSLALTGAPIGGLVLVPLSTTLIARFDIPTAATTLAGLAWGIVLPAAILVVRNGPADLGLWPDGEPAAPEHHPVALEGVAWTARAALRTTTWWTITLAFSLTLLGQVAYLIHQVSFLSPRLGLPGAGLAVGATATAGLLGRFLLGSVGDRLPKRWLACGCCLLQGTAVIAAVQSDSPPLLYATAAAFGLTTGIVVALHPLMLAERFGLRSHGAVYGPAYLATQLGGAVGTLLVGMLADLNASYSLPLTLTGAAAVVAAGLVLIGTPPASPVRRLA